MLSELREFGYSGEGSASDRGSGGDPPPPCACRAMTVSPRSSACSCASLSIKRKGRVPFDRDKLMRSVQIALRKRPVDPERIEQTVSKIVRELESLGESEITRRPSAS